MRVEKAVQLAVLAAAGAWLWEPQGCAAATTPTFRICGRRLSELMSRVCLAYNSPAWDDPTQSKPIGAVRRRRDVGIADLCCNYSCTWDELTDYCVSTNSELPQLYEEERHQIADRSAEASAPSATSSSVDGGAPAVVSPAAAAARAREVGRRERGYGRGGGGGRCRCRRRKRAGRRTTSTIMGNMNRIRVASRAAPIVGTVSPLLTWGRTLHTDLPPPPLDRYAYLAVHARPPPAAPAAPVVPVAPAATVHARP